MAITSSDIKLRLSGGASNTNPDNALGGAMSTASGGIVTSNQLNNDMDDITSAEASSGITIYRGYYWRNEHASLTYIGPKIYIASQTSSGDTSVEIALGDEAKNTALETITNETTAPSGPSFSTPANFAAGISMGDLEDDDYRGFWVKYIVNSGAAAAVDSYAMGIQGDTNP